MNKLTDRALKQIRDKTAVLFQLSAPSTKHGPLSWSLEAREFSIKRRDGSTEKAITMLVGPDDRDRMEATKIVLAHLEHVSTLAVKARTQQVRQSV